jgi:phosphatidylinositol dimannoside acyltransferase
MKNTLLYWGYNAGWSLLGFIPEKFGRKLFSFIAIRVYQGNKKSVQQLRANFKQVTGSTGLELEKLVNAGVQSYFKYWYEAFVLSNWSGKKINQIFTMTNKEKLDEILKTEEKVVLVLPHMGNWDAAAYWFSNNYGELTTVAEKLAPVKLYEKFIKFRNQLGVEVIPLEHNGEVFHKLLERLNQNKVVALLADRDISKTGIKINFFDKVAAMPAGPAALAYATGAVVVPIKVYNDENNQIFAEVRDVLTADSNLMKAEAVKELTQKMAISFEKMISESPTDWHLMQRIWIDVKPIKVG